MGTDLGRAAVSARRGGGLIRCYCPMLLAYTIFPQLGSHYGSETTKNALFSLDRPSRPSFPNILRHTTHRLRSSQSVFRVSPFQV